MTHGGAPDRTAPHKPEGRDAIVARGRKKTSPDSVELAASTLVTIGALNWGLVGLLNFDLVAAFLGKRTLLSRLVYTAVGASAVYLITDAAND
jgi:uncharacterized membrane protein YuzA (DUF378 family)